MKKTIIILFSLSLLTSCLATKLASKRDYFGTHVGESASISDTTQRQSRSKANVFYVAKIDDLEIDNSFRATNRATYGQGFDLNTVNISREVPSKPIKLLIVGKTVHAAPINAMFGTNYSIERDINFNPKANTKYLVKGVLGQQYSAIWIEDSLGVKATEVFESFAKEVTDRDAYRKQTETKVLTTDISDSDFFIFLDAGVSAKDIKKRLGEPNYVEFSKGSIFSSAKPKTKYIYNDYGTVILTRDRIGDLFVEKVWPKVETVKLTNKHLSQLLSTNNTLTLQYIAKELNNGVISDIALLDIIADKIWSQKHSEDSYVVDSMAWLCKIFAKSNNYRYKTLFEKIKAQAVSSKLTKYASHNLNNIKASDAEQYIPQ